jgi:hypothetical protein
MQRNAWIQAKPLVRPVRDAATDRIRHPVDQDVFASAF